MTTLDGVAITDRITDEVLASLALDEGYPSIGERLAAGETQEQATAYLINERGKFGIKAEYDEDGVVWPYLDDQAVWFRAYVVWIHGRSR